MSLEKPKSLTASRSNAMKPSELEAFLAEPREARLATIRADSSVHLTPVWFIAEVPCSASVWRRSDCT